MNADSFLPPFHPECRVQDRLMAERLMRLLKAKCELFEYEVGLRSGSLEQVVRVVGRDVVEALNGINDVYPGFEVVHFRKVGAASL